MNFIRSIFLSIALTLGSASATTYHVDLTGDDTNSGLEVSPWRPLANACNTVAANQGHLIQVGEGTFTEAGILTLKSGVSLIGAGSGKTKILVSHFFSLTDAEPDANPPQRGSHASFCKRLATRLGTDEAKQLADALKAN